MSKPEKSLSDFAAALAPEVDRLFVAGHRSARPHAEPIRKELAPQGFGVLIDFRKLLLGSRRLPLSDAEVIERYVESAVIKHALDRHVVEGFLELHQDRYIPSGRGERLLLRLTEAIDKGLRMLPWSESEAATVDAWCRQVITEAAGRLPAELYPAFTADRLGWVPSSGSPSFALWSTIGTLRYLRADAHALAWRRHGLRMKEAVVLTMACYKELPFRVDSLQDELRLPMSSREATLRSLRERGWLRESAEGWEVTVQGRDTRVNIEHMTNELNAQPFIVLDGARRVRLLHGLRSLPDSG